MTTKVKGGKACPTGAIALTNVPWPMVLAVKRAAAAAGMTTRAWALQVVREKLAKGK